MRHHKRITKRKEIIYFTTHSTHFIYGYMEYPLYKEGNVLFNDALDTFYLRLYGVRLAARGLLYAPHTDRELHVSSVIETLKMC